MSQALIEVEPGVRLFVQQVGSGDPVVLIPGWAMSHATWDSQVRVLADTHRVVCIDLRGHGRSDKPYGDYSIDRHAADVAAVLAAVDLRGVTLVGWSMGGSVAFRVAATVPDRVIRLVLAGSNGVKYLADDAFPNGFPVEAATTLLDGELHARPRYRREAMTAAMFKPDDPTVDWLVADSMQTPSWAGAASIEGLLAADHRADMAAVTIPVLFLHGAEDAFWNVAGSRWVAERLSNARLVELPACGHCPHIEAADIFNQELERFLAADGNGAPR
jgi:pimeloyl-ACP methyl ester carboxylesterase